MRTGGGAKREESANSFTPKKCVTITWNTETAGMNSNVGSDTPSNYVKNGRQMVNVIEVTDVISDISQR